MSFLCERVGDSCIFCVWRLVNHVSFVRWWAMGLLRERWVGNETFVIEADGQCGFCEGG